MYCYNDIPSSVDNGVTEQDEQGCCGMFNVGLVQLLRKSALNEGCTGKILV